MSVPEIQFLVKIPDNMSLSVASMLPSGALAALNTVRKAEVAVQNILEKKGPDGEATLQSLLLFALESSRRFADLLVRFDRFQCGQACATFWWWARAVWRCGRCVWPATFSAISRTASTSPWPACATRASAWPRSAASEFRMALSFIGTSPKLTFLPWTGWT